jgi:DUF971 family protein
MAAIGVCPDARPGNPVALHIDGRARRLDIEWPDGTRSSITHRQLRLQCPCALCRQVRKVRGVLQVSDDIELTGVEPYGPSAVNLAFGDGHGRGIFPFPYLRALAETCAVVD